MLSKMVPYALNQHYYNLQYIGQRTCLQNPNCCLMVDSFYKQRFTVFPPAFDLQLVFMHLSRKQAICRCSLTFLAFKQIQSV